MNAIVTPPYPLGAFHLIIRNALEEVCRHVQAPDALVGMAFLTTLSVSCQGLIDVRLPSGQVRPVSLNIKTVADSGERKSAVDSLASAPIYAYDEARAKKYEADLAEYYVELRFWRAVDAGIRHQVTKRTQKGEPVDDLHRQLSEHAAKAPRKPRLRRIMRHNATERSIMEALEGDGESIAFMSDEGEVILKGGAMNQTGLRNKGWDGARLLAFDRADAESIIARNPRVTVAFMVQQAVLRAFVERHGDVARGSGHWARYLVGWPSSTQGMRFMSYADPVWVHLPAFHARVTEMLEEYGRSIDAGKVERTVVEFSDEAKARWIDMVNTTESMVQPWGYLNDIKDFASKAMEIVARVAALLHWFTQQEGKLSLDTLNRALTIVEWHIHEFKRIFSPQCAIPQVQVDAQALEHYLYTHYWCNHFTIAPKNDALKNGPVRPSQRFETALEYLRALGRVWITADNKRKRYINLHAQHFGSMPGAIQVV
ncbi:YfjI family protein [Noviherbaspirillum massiliense]|uniref:YfjI family protein n=1 Tax=Noviherbaspirillum massiliense TaxID=1465823 RepID=UPI0002DA0E67|nr:YfjI family protein [Noviherbaspirillum massiliense]